MRPKVVGASALAHTPADDCGVLEQRTGVMAPSRNRDRSFETRATFTGKDDNRRRSIPHSAIPELGTSIEPPAAYGGVLHERTGVVVTGADRGDTAESGASRAGTHRPPAKACLSLCRRRDRRQHSSPSTSPSCLPRVHTRGHCEL